MNSRRSAVLLLLLVGSLPAEGSCSRRPEGSAVERGTKDIAAEMNQRLDALAMSTAAGTTTMDGENGAKYEVRATGTLPARWPEDFAPPLQATLLKGVEPLEADGKPSPFLFALYE